MKTLSLILKQFGPPEDGISFEQIELPKVESNQILVEMKAAPVNPADINLVEGKYGILPDLPAVPGNEGVGVVTEIGTNVHNYAVGDMVIFPNQIGAWCSHRICHSEQLIKLKNSFDYYQAAMMAVNPPTAWRLLHDFTTLRPGDWIIQNAANSAVGRIIIQLAHVSGIKTVNIVRRKELVSELTDIGADIVLVDEDRYSKRVKETTNNAPIRLGINAVGGNSAKEIAKTLSSGGSMVTYGAMGMEPVIIGNALLIFKNISFHGFWITAWYQKADDAEIQTMFDQLSEVIEANKINVPIEAKYPLSAYKQAINHARKSKRSGKILFDCNI